MNDKLESRHLSFVQAAGVRTRVYDAGVGEPLVLIHGGLYGSLYSLDSFSSNLTGLGAQFRLVAFDKLGQGHTGNPAHYTFASLLEHALELIDALDLGPVHLLGHSMGALLAAQIAYERPDLARSLVLVDSNTIAPDDPRFPRGAFYRELETRIPAGAPTRAIVRMEPDEQSWATEHVSDDFLDRLLEIANLPSFREAAAAIGEVREAAWEPTLEETRRGTLGAIDYGGLPCPTLVVWGADDPSAPLPLALALFERIAAKTPRTELHVLAHAGHYCFREQPEAFDRLITAFCDGA
jgi:2-hydroxy-6-oxonona-2,4-dienedioate hydrolase